MSEKDIAVLGIDLGKNICSLAGFDRAGNIVFKKRMRPSTIPKFTAKLSQCVVAMEACCGAHFLGRRIATQDHDVRLMSPEYVRPYVKAQKNDERDAEAIAEAATRPTMRFVELKSEAQLDMQTLHRARSRLVGIRTMLINQLRAVLIERGLTFPQGRRKLELALDELLADEVPGISERMVLLVKDMREEWRELDQRIAKLDREFLGFARSDEAAKRLTSVPGIGPLTATALIAAVGNASSFQRGRDLGAWLGLVPRQRTTGGKPRLLGISRRGNTYLRTLFIHCARAALPWLAKHETRLGLWLRTLLVRSHRNVVVVALANKLVRIAWATLHHKTPFRNEPGILVA